MQKFENKRRTRMLATAAVIAMALCVLAAIVPGDSDAAEPSAAVAEIDGVTYASLQQAEDAAANGDVIKIQSDFSTSEPIHLDSGKIITLDLNGHEISGIGAEKYTIIIENGTELTVTDSGDGGSITSVYRVIKVGSATLSSTGTPASLVMDGGTLESYNSSDHCAIAAYANNTGNRNENSSVSCDVTINKAAVIGGIYIFGEGATLTVNDGAYIEATDTYAISGNGTKNSSQNNGGTVITITGGTINQIGDDGAAIYHPQNGVLTITGSPMITGSVGIQLCSGEGTITTISGGTVHAFGPDGRESKTGDGFIPDGGAISIVDRNYPGGTPQMKISGGTFISEETEALMAYTWSNNSSSEWVNAENYIEVTGGLFSSDVSDYCPEGYSCIPIGNQYSIGKTQVPDESGTVVSDTTEAVVENTGLSADIILQTGSVSISSTGGNRLGNMSVSIVDNSENMVDDSIARYEIDIVVGSGITYRAEITVPADIPSGYQPLMYYIDDAGELRPVEVLSYTSSSVTFVTDHTTPFLVFLGEEVPDYYPGWDDDDYPIIIPEQTESNDESEIAVIVAAAAAAAVLMCVFVLMGRGKI